MTSTFHNNLLISFMYQNYTRDFVVLYTEIARNFGEAVKHQNGT